MVKARKLILMAGVFGPATALAQVPDMLTALDAGGRALGAGSSLNTTSVSTLSATYNPASLGYVTRSQIGVAARSLPASQTSVSGALNDLRLSTDTEEGDMRGSHVGFAVPLKRGMAANMVLGVAWTIGGWFHDTQFGSNLDNGIASYLDFTKSQTDFINISLGSASSDQSTAWGVGIVYAQQNVRNFQRTTFTDTNIPPQVADTDTTGNGFGLQAGIMVTPRSNPNLTLALTARTPINLKHSGEALNLYERIPGRVAGGIALRRDGFRGGRDFLVLGAEFQHFFSGKDSPRLDREDQTTGHFGAEYNWVRGEGVIPIRIGYSVVPEGGDGFDSRNSFTYGLGYRPNHGDWVIEINFGKPENSGKETSIYVSWRFGK